MDDLISRRAAIRWVKTECNPYGRPTLDFESGEKVIEHLEQMPSAQRWIPCSERLPDESKWYLISNGLDSWVAIWSKENKEWLSVTGLDYTITDVIAWMEFPEPPKEET